MMADPPVAVVTGPTSGIGRWIALGLAHAGYRVVLVARNVGKAEATQSWIGARVAGAATEIVRADLSLMREARRVGDEIGAHHGQIARLINNAGLMTRYREVTAEGHEMILAVNHLAPFVLTRTLQPALQAGSAARVVNVGSAAADNAKLNLDDLEGARAWNGLRAYGQSKLALLMASLEWAERMRGHGVTVNVAHPGLVATAIGDLGGVAGLIWRGLTLFALSPEQGAAGPLNVALASELAGETGRYFKRRKPAEPNPLARDPSLRARLWAETERLVEG
jgi:NAD(P)-dependent dehydrogenase (short-subunit alcohol dehydrogenase family)